MLAKHPGRAFFQFTQVNYPVGSGSSRPESQTHYLIQEHPKGTFTVVASVTIGILAAFAAPLALLAFVVFRRVRASTSGTPAA